jgi:hypothetical protein
MVGKTGVPSTEQWTMDGQTAASLQCSATSPDVSNEDMVGAGSSTSHCGSADVQTHQHRRLLVQHCHCPTSISSYLSAPSLPLAGPWMYNRGADCDDALALYFDAKCWMVLPLLVGADLSLTLCERAMFGAVRRHTQGISIPWQQLSMD